MIVPVFGEQIALPVSVNTVGCELIVIVIVFELAVLVLRQVPPVIVMVQVTVLPLANVVDVKLLRLPLCTLLPLTLKL